MLTNGKGLPPLSEEKLAAQAKRKAAKVHSNVDGEFNPKRMRGEFQQPLADPNAMIQNAYQNPYMTTSSWPTTTMEPMMMMTDASAAAASSAVCVLLFEKEVFFINLVLG